MYYVIYRVNHCMLDQVRIVLVNTSHMGNVGGVARAMKNMGINNLYLVDPEGTASDQSAVARASGASDVLQSSVVCQTLDEALEGCSVVIGASARSRHIPWPLCTPRECAKKISQVTEHNNQVALVFGRESRGLTNEELHRCTMHVHIPTNADFSSLNLAAAVQILCYEVRLAWENTLESKEKTPQLDNVWGVDWDYEMATHDDLEHFFVHLESTLVAIKFLDPKTPKQLMTRLRRLYQRTGMDKVEVNVLRGILAAIDKNTLV
jgi:tRNA (cytidine32/uridine32-2'-O)-methyltransferase